MSGPHGVLVVDKPRGMTSHDVVAEARRRFATRAVGHAGTLDPMATGVLLLLFGEATKLSGFLTAEDKRYRAEIAFGRSTDSFDADGETSEERPAPPLEPGVIEAALSLERVRREQVPPAYSAIKVDGERAHRLARRGLPPELAPRPVTVHSLEIETFAESLLKLDLRVSKGYFVRSLVRDLCSTLGVAGHLSGLCRLSSGAFSLVEASPWPAAGAGLLSVAAAATRCLPAQTLRSEAVILARQGKKLKTGDFAALPPTAGPCAWLDPDGKLVAIGIREDDHYRVMRGFSES